MDGTQGGHQEYTDLDVLGIGFTPGGHLHTTFADCKTSTGRVLERMFWVRGVADFVLADDAYLVRLEQVPPAARTLSGRLEIAVLTPDDLSSLESTFETDVDLSSGPVALLFDPVGAGNHLNAYMGASGRLDRLLDFLNFDYWIYEPSRNLTQVVAQLSAAVRTLDPKNPQHRVLLYDCAWHYALSLARAVAFVRATRIGDVPLGVQTYISGGELSLQEKRKLAELLAKARIADGRTELVFPPYIEALVELVQRFLVQPAEMATVLRYAEYLAVTESNRVADSVLAAFGEGVRPVAAKLLADVCSFLVTSAGLRPEFRDAARSRLVVDLTGGVAIEAPAAEATAGAAASKLPLDG